MSTVTDFLHALEREMEHLPEAEVDEALDLLDDLTLHLDGLTHRQREDGEVTSKSMTVDPPPAPPRYRCNSQTGDWIEICHLGICRRVDDPHVLAWLENEL